MQSKKRHGHREKTWTPKRGIGGRMNWEIGIDRYTVLCIKQITNENPLYSTGNST